ncbi:MAG: hypothetical protein LUG16_02910 [Candidatus Gastranaerophilales bacterium]|nr:hypothetical protein [Candidatus Gastranaerophilales bacterium]
MNPKLIKFAVELQCGEVTEKKPKKIYFKKSLAKLFGLDTPVKVPLVVEKTK